MTVQLANFQLIHELRYRHPEIIAHHQQTLHSTALAMPQRFNEFGCLFHSLHMQPLFKLIQDNQHLAASRNASPTPQDRDRVSKPPGAWQVGAGLPQSTQQLCLRFARAASTNTQET